MICPSRMRPNSSASGSFTLTIISARFQTSSREAIICAPAFLNSSSVTPEPTPAPACTSTVWPRLVRMRTPAGIMPTRYSRVLISVGTPMIMARLSSSARLAVKALEESEPLHDLLLPAQDGLDAELVLQVHLKVVLCEQLVLRRLPVLAHHDDRRLQRRDRRQAQVEQDVRIDVPGDLVDGVDAHPEPHDPHEDEDEAPRAAEG